MSCDNPGAEDTATMTRRRKYDKSKTCVKCKQTSGHIVIRHAPYCKECFVPLVTFRFRKALEPHINAKPDGPRRTALRPTGNLLVAFSGGLGSSVLLDLVNRCYVSPDDTLLSSNGADGGRDHPRHERVWKKVTACYVDISDGIPETRDRTDEVKAIVEQCPGIDFLPLRLQHAFNDSFWAKAGVAPPSISASVNITETGPPLSLHSSAYNTPDPEANLRHYLGTLPTPSALPSTVDALVRVLLQHAALITGSSHLLYGTTLTSLAVSLISGVSHGGGFHVREEAQEEWISSGVTESTVNGASEGPDRRSVRLIRPLRDIGRKECGAWSWWMHLRVAGRDEIQWPGTKPSITKLTKDFILGLEADFPSTVSTIVRTCAKLVPKGESIGTCAICHRPLQNGVQEWKDRIAIRSRTDQHPYASSAANSLASYLCYVCHTNLTSRSARSAPPLFASLNENEAVPLPFWTNRQLEERLPAGVHNPIPGENTGELRRMPAESMREIVEEYLLDDQ